MTEADPERIKLSEVLSARADETRAQLKLSELRINQILTTIEQSAEGETQHAAMKIFHDTVTAARELGRVESEVMWVTALNRAGIDFKDIFRAWDIKDEISRHHRKSLSNPDSQ